MPTAPENPYARTLKVAGASYRYYDVTAVPGADRLPVSLKILLENVIRRAPSAEAAQAAAEKVVAAGLAGKPGEEIEFMPARVLFQDFTGVPVFVDFAAMRDAAAERGADPALINPQIPCTLVVDHSVTADVAGCPGALERNMELEAARNAERFSFLKWASESFDNVRIVPPGVGICHQLNVERFCRVVWDGATADGVREAYFDTLVGTDSHTPTANGLGVLGWGVGGIEAEAAALGQPVTMRVPAVVGVRLTGALSGGACAMDVALAFAEKLRAEGVVGCLVECFGPGVATLSATQRATIANMTPEYGATATLFPADEAALAQLELTGSADAVPLARAYLTAQGILADPSAAACVQAPAPEPVYAKVLELDLSAVEPSLAGPSRPHNRVSISGLKDRVRATCAEHGCDLAASFEIETAGEKHLVHHGALAIAAITSCTTATDPAMMLAAGLAAKKAVELGAEPVPWVKKVLAPGSRATAELLARSGLIEPLERLGFYVCGFGCMSCIGNSGEIDPALKPVAEACDLASVLSGNRNFDGRISPDVAQNYLAAPALVVAYSLVGRMDVDLSCEPVFLGENGPVMLADIMPDDDEVAAAVRAYVTPELFSSVAGTLFAGDEAWDALGAEPSATYAWDAASTYVRNPPYFHLARPLEGDEGISGARVLALLGDFVTTDHISPAGAIARDSSAAAYLRAHGVADADFNTYGARRGNHEVMMRGCFANVKLENRLAAGRVGAWSRNMWTGEVEPLFACAEVAREHGAPLVVVAGKMYGSGSSRDWAAKAPALLGVRAVIAESFERIHRSNLIGMGILPLEFLPGQSAESLGLTGCEVVDIAPVDVSGGLPQPAVVEVAATAEDGTVTRFEATVRVDTPTEGAYLAAGGILPYVLNGLVERAEGGER